MTLLPAPVKLNTDPLRLPLEAFLSTHLERPWTVQSYTDLIDFACHPAALLSDGSYPVFAKFTDAPDGLHQFEVEAGSLRLLSDRAGVFTPKVVGILPIDTGTLLIMEEVPAVERTSLRWRQIGAALARLHMVKSDRFGLENDVYFGPLHQDNTPADDWATFYRERRLLPGLKMAFDSGNLPVELVKPIERIISRLPSLCGPTVAPALLHGDAQQNNYISAEAGACIIDPAVYYGHPEMDLAWLDAFVPVPQEVFDGYRAVLPIDPGFWERRPLWKLWGYLAAVSIDGEPYASMLTESIRKLA
jgi:protein-ribulosamine 3-kinase